MEQIAFSPIRDILLTIALLAGFLLNYRFWVRTGSAESGIDLSPRLPQAYLRTTLFFTTILVVCWLANMTFLVPLGILFLAGIVFSIGFGNTLSGEFFFVATALLLREWAFGFPNLILSPKVRESKPREQHELVGAIGTTTSELRPAGYARINDKEIPAISANGKQVDAETKIVVTDFKNGHVHVRAPESD